MNKQKESKSNFDFQPYWAMYADASVLYVVIVQGSPLVFKNKIEAEKHQSELKKTRGLESELQEIQK